MNDINHGTDAGYKAHHKRGILPCEPCKAARRKVDAARRAKQKAAEPVLERPHWNWLDEVVVERVRAGVNPGRALSDREVRALAGMTGWTTNQVARAAGRNFSAVAELIGGA